MEKRIFVSFPYGDKDKTVTQLRVTLAAHYCMKLKMLDHIPFAPAVMGHMMVNSSMEYDVSFASWKKMCLSYLEICEEVHVLLVKENAMSLGVAYEVEHARSLGIPVHFIDDDQC